MVVMVSLVAQSIKNLPAVQEKGQSLGREDPLKKEMAAHSSLLSWEIPWTENRGKVYQCHFELGETEAQRGLETCTCS